MKSGKYFILTAALLATVSVWSQTPEAATAAPAAEQGGGFASIMTWVLTIAASIMIIVSVLYMLWVNKFMYNRLVKLEALRTGVALPEDFAADQGDDFWTRLRKKYWEDAVPIEREHEIILHHDFDGIRELDNRLPPWWINMFYITIVWAAVYLYYYHIGSGPSQKQEYDMEMETAKKEVAKAVAGQANKVDETSVTALTDPGMLGLGEAIFKSNCASCHGQNLEGGIGPNLTDEYWLHGGGVKNIFKTIKYGVPEKGMIAWQATISPGDIQKISSYILSKQGTKPANGKEPQGTIWKEEAGATTPAADTTQAATPAPSK